MSLTIVPPGQIATIVTSLDMRARPRPRPLPMVALRLTRWKEPRIEPYRALFRRIGGPWLWFSRLALDDSALAGLISDPAIEIFAVQDPRGIEIGMLELDFRAAGMCELSYFGLVKELTGKGIGQWLMAQALGIAWRKGVTRVWVHTCTFDHPAALGFYRKAGFTPFATAIEMFPDPRLIGLLPRDAAPHVPLIAPDAEAASPGQPG